MANKLYEENDISAIAAAIRSKSLSEDKFKVSEMAQKIIDLQLNSSDTEEEEKWIRPSTWPDLDQYWYAPTMHDLAYNLPSVHDSMYFTIDTSSAMAKKMIVSNNLEDDAWMECVKYVPLSFSVNLVPMEDPAQYYNNRLKGTPALENVIIESIGDPSGDWQEMITNGGTFLKWFPVNDENPYIIIHIIIPEKYQIGNFYFCNIDYQGEKAPFESFTSSLYNSCPAWNNPVIERIDYFFEAPYSSQGEWKTTIHLKRERLATVQGAITREVNSTATTAVGPTFYNWFHGAISLESAEFLDNQEYVDCWDNFIIEEGVASYTPGFSHDLALSFNFANCVSLKYLDLGKLKINWHILPGMYGTLYNCIKLKNIDFSGWTYNSDLPVNSFPEDLQVFWQGEVSESFSYKNLEEIFSVNGYENFKGDIWSIFDPFGFTVSLTFSDRFGLDQIITAVPEENILNGSYLNTYYLNHIEKLDISNIDLSLVKSSIGCLTCAAENLFNHIRDIDDFSFWLDRRGHRSANAVRMQSLLEGDVNGGYTFLESLLNMGFQGELVVGEINKNKLHPIFTKPTTLSVSAPSTMVLSGHIPTSMATTLSKQGAGANGNYIPTSVLETFIDCLTPVTAVLVGLEEGTSFKGPEFPYYGYNVKEVRSKFQEKGYEGGTYSNNQEINPFNLRLMGEPSEE